MKVTKRILKARIEYEAEDSDLFLAGYYPRDMRIVWAYRDAIRGLPEGPIEVTIRVLEDKGD